MHLRKADANVAYFKVGSIHQDFTRFGMHAIPHLDTIAITVGYVLRTNPVFEQINKVCD